MDDIAKSFNSPIQLAINAVLLSQGMVGTLETSIAGRQHVQRAEKLLADAKQELLCARGLTD